MTDFVQQLFDLLEFLVRQSSRMDTFDLSSKVFELGRIRGGWKGERKDFDGHYTFVGSGVLGVHVRWTLRGAAAFPFNSKEPQRAIRQLGPMPIPKEKKMIRNMSRGDSPSFKNQCEWNLSTTIITP